jgi:hypothetical protein
MASEESWMRSEYREIIFYIFFTIFLSVTIPWLVGLALRGFENSFIVGQPLEFGSYLVSSVLYIPFLLATIFCIIFPIGKLVSMKQNEHPAEKPNPTWFRLFTVSYIYSPESNGLFWYLSEKMGLKKNFMKWSLNPLRVLIVSILLFGIFGIFLVANPQIAVAGIPEQQITTISEVSFGALIPAITENGSLLFIFMFLMGISAYVSSKSKWGKTGFFIFGFFICILMGIIWMGFHLIVYGNSDANLFSTFLFGFLGSLITLLTGTWIPWTIWHIMNNAFLILRKMISLKEDIYAITIISLILLLVIWIGIEILNRKIRKKKEEVSIPV